MPATGPSERTWPRRRDKTVYTEATASAGPSISHAYTGSINRGDAIRKDE